MEEVDAFLRDLIRLRHGRGLDTVKLRDRISPRLADMFGIGASDSDQVVRSKIRTRIRSLTARFPVDQRQAIEVTLGAAPGAQLAQLSERIALLAAESHHSTRTARRHVDDAYARLAAEAAESAATRPAPDVADVDDPERGWHVERLESLLRLDTARPEVTETRTIVAERNGLRQIAIRFTVPPSGAEPAPERLLDVDVAHGARIASINRSGTSHFIVLLDLPRPLVQDERHRYTIIFRLPEGQTMRPHYALIPLVRIDSFHVRVRFDPADPPAVVLAFARLPPRSIDDPDVPGEQLVLDYAFEVEREFRPLDRAFAYGISWTSAT